MSSTVQLYDVYQSLSKHGPEDVQFFGRLTLKAISQFLCLRPEAQRRIESEAKPGNLLSVCELYSDRRLTAYTWVLAAHFPLGTEAQHNLSKDEWKNLAPMIYRK